MIPLPPRCPDYSTVLRLGGMAGAAGLLVFLISTCAVFRPLPPTPAPAVEVRLTTQGSRLEIRVDAPYEVFDASGGLVARGARLRPGLVTAPTGGGLELNGVALRGGGMTLKTGAGSVFEINGGRYPGQLRVMRDGAGNLVVHNVLDMESYVAGVLFSEMPAGWSEEALKAQAVAARSYARWRQQQGAAFLTATQADQVYGGEGALHEQAMRIVEATRGEVLEWQGSPLPAYFSSTCGGATGSVDHVFHMKPLPPLSGVVCDHCQQAPRYRWQRTLPTRDLVQRLGLPVARIREVRIRGRDSHGRPGEVVFLGEGFERSLDALELRARWNTSAEPGADLPSAFLTEVRGDDRQMTLHGNGYGHGVGMCQYGCQGLARSGRDYREILAYYYPGSLLARVW